MPTLFTEIVNQLFLRMEELVPIALYPKKVLQVPRRIIGTAFFPGGGGLYLEPSLETSDPSNIESPFGGVMILGHNFDSECGFWRSFYREKEMLTKGTWLGILNRINAEPNPIPLSRCFFTNAFMGLCEGCDNKNYLGRGNETFRDACASFLRVQIEAQKPRLIVTLGLQVPPLLASITSDLEPWRGRLKSGSCDPELLTEDINSGGKDHAGILKSPILTARFKFKDRSEHKAVVVPITHPSYEHLNLKLRHPLGYSDGLEGEIELMREGWKGAKQFED